MARKTTPSNCPPEEVALKAFFLGPQSENSTWILPLLDEIFTRWFAWRQSLNVKDGRAISEQDQNSPEFRKLKKRFSKNVDIMLSRFEREVPKFSPRYIGHMFSEISLPALLGHIIALLHNANNVSGESAQTGVLIEFEAISALNRMLNYPKNSLGHFTSGGTIANFEALVRARTRCAHWLAASARNPGRSETSAFVAASIGWQRFDSLPQRLTWDTVDPFHITECDPISACSALSERFGHSVTSPIILAPQSAHYSWTKGAGAFGFGSSALVPVKVDAKARMDLKDLQQKIENARREKRAIAMIVSIAGTTELGQFDPIDQIQDYLDELAIKDGIHLWHHVDAAYGGFFSTLDRKDPILDADLQRAINALGRAQSVTIDPHKLGYVPYACGAFLVRDPRDYAVINTNAPYIRFDSRDLGPFTLEGSRAATGAAATWMTSETIGFSPNGYGRIISRTVYVRQQLEARLKSEIDGMRIAPGSATNVLCFTIAKDKEDLQFANTRIKKIAEMLSPAAHGPFTVSTTTITRKRYGHYFETFIQSWKNSESDEIHLIRLCLLNPFFETKEMDVNFLESFTQTIQKLAQMA